MSMSVEKAMVSQKQTSSILTQDIKTQIKTQITPTPTLMDIDSLCGILGCNIDFFFNKIKKYTDLQLYLDDNKITFVGSINVEKFNELLYVLIKECFLCKECGSTQLSKKCDLCGTKASSMRKRISFAKTEISKELEHKIQRLKKFDMIDPNINPGTLSDSELVTLEEKVNSLVDSIDRRYSECMDKLYIRRDKKLKAKEDKSEIDRIIDTFWDDKNDNISFLESMESYLSK